MKGVKVLLLSVLTILGSSVLSGQELTQSIRGQIIDADSEIPVIGATVVIVGSNPIVGTSTDVDGYFRLENIPVGRVSLEVSYIGYESRTIPNILVNSAKEVFLNIDIIESVNELEAIEVVGNNEKDEPINEMAIIGSRQFSTEETKRYAGSINDPARMVSNFAGVNGDAEGNNDIVVRGNSPKGILWRMEGIEIPNPNHFATEGATGGPINALNSKMLSNSEFLTAAFAPEYGNGTSGVFDIKLRQGNNEQREYSFGFGVFGTDFTVEGPFKEGGKSSYLANYRYSSLAILDDAGVVDFGGVPKYQDASFNLFLPTKNAGIFKVFGLGGISNILDEEKFSEEIDSTVAKNDVQAHLGFVGVSHTYIINDRTYVKSNVSLANNGSAITRDRRMNDNSYEVEETAELEKYSAKVATSLNKKLNAKNKISAGIIHTQQTYTFDYQDRNQNDVMEKILDVSEGTSFSQLHGTWKHRFNEDLTLVTGMHFLQFHLNETYSAEPRIGLSYKVKDNQTFTAGFGVHSKIESLLYYTANVTDANGNVGQPNKNLEIPKANHYVIGYDYHFAENTHVKTEVYYQDLYDVPVENDINSTYSLINQSDWFDDVELVNKGKGKNYGVELTLERYFANNFYYLLTTSVYESKYQTLDGKWRRGRFDGNYNGNFLIGKEFRVGKPGKNKTLMLSTKTALQGGNRYTPIDLDASIAAGETVREDDPFSKKGDDVLSINIAAAYRVNRKKTTHELKFEVLNATNNQAKVTEYYSDYKQEIETSHQLPMIPNIMYTLSF